MFPKVFLRPSAASPPLPRPPEAGSAHCHISLAVVYFTAKAADPYLPLPEGENKCVSISSFT